MQQPVQNALERLAKVVPHPGPLTQSPPVYDNDGQHTYSVRLCYHMAIGERRDELRNLLRNHCTVMQEHYRRRADSALASTVARGAYMRLHQVYSSMNDLGTFLSAVADLYDSLAMTHAHALHVGRHQKILNATAGMCQFTNRARRLAGALTVASLVSSYIAGIAAIARDGDLKVSGIGVANTIGAMPGVHLDPRRIGPMLRLAEGLPCEFVDGDPCATVVERTDRVEIAREIIESAHLMRLTGRHGGIRTVLPNAPEQVECVLVRTGHKLEPLSFDALWRDVWYGASCSMLHRNGVPHAAVLYNVSSSMVPSAPISEHEPAATSCIAVCDSIPRDGSVYPVVFLFEIGRIAQCPLSDELCIADGQSSENMTPAMLWRLVLASIAGPNPAWPSVYEALRAIQHVEETDASSRHSARAVAWRALNAHVTSQDMVQARKIDQSRVATSRDVATTKLNTRRKRTKDTFCFSELGSSSGGAKDLQHNEAAVRLVQRVMEPIVEETLTRPCADTESIQRLIDIVAKEVEIAAVTAKLSRREPVA